jgi:transcriptional regulator with XRE-family HTH domain
MDVIDQILDRAERLGLTQSDVEVRACLAQGRISKWKRGKGEPYFTQVVAMAKVVGASLDELAGNAPTGPQTSDEALVWKVVNQIGASAAFALLMEMLPKPKIKLEGGGVEGKRSLPAPDRRDPDDRSA